MYHTAMNVLYCYEYHFHNIIIACHLFSDTNASDREIYYDQNVYDIGRQRLGKHLWFRKLILFVV